MSAICWLASYPKSGNTWVRMFLANLQADGDRPAAINAPRGDSMASRRELIDAALGVPTADLSEHEIACYRPQAYRSLAARNQTSHRIKVHDLYGLTPDGEPLFPSEVSSGVVYIVRNPLDVAVSLKYFANQALDVIIERMSRPEETLNRMRGGLAMQVPQRIGSWSSHAASWLDQSAMPVLCLRYEDLLWQPLAGFTRLAAFAGLPQDTGTVEKAIAHSAFAELHRQEQQGGFRERPGSAVAPFFRKGRVGSWRDELGTSQVRQLLDGHGSMMRRLGYLSPEGELRDCCPATRQYRTLTT